ncbi:nuclear transport factor 2 family protein [Erythrobacter sp. G21629-S1]|jgi:3-phenylpropionate/cinnamic acid dioxygenase small subunit|nr:nuclear transport factor 2 family protein [Erythrobacter sp. G21629-S1]
MDTLSQTTAEDRVLISDLIARVALFADTALLDDYATLFTDNAVWDLRGAPSIEGLDAIVSAAYERRAQKITGPESDTRHVVLSSVIDRTQDGAKAVSVFHFYTDFSQSPKLYAMGVYNDQFEFDDGRWRLSRRVIDFTLV